MIAIEPPRPPWDMSQPRHQRWARSREMGQESWQLPADTVKERTDTSN